MLHCQAYFLQQKTASEESGVDYYITVWWHVTIMPATFYALEVWFYQASIST